MSEDTAPHEALEAPPDVAPATPEPAPATPAPEPQQTVERPTMDSQNYSEDPPPNSLLRHTERRKEK
jgi:hypothetical protein